MSMVEKLEIIIVTYNRERYLRRTLETFLSEGSPVRDCRIVILDNKSNDGTQATALAFCATHSNVEYRRNRHNLGLAGNIVRAMEIAEREYAWIVGDDDAYDWTGWGEVEEMMCKGERIICLARYLLPEDRKDDLAYQLVQITFITGCICRTELFDDSCMLDVVNSAYTLFPLMIPIVRDVNRGGRIAVVRHAVADNGLLLGEEKDCSYTRGAKKADELSPRSRATQWIIGWAAVCGSLSDKATRESVFMRGVDVICGSMQECLAGLKPLARERRTVMLIAEVYAVVPTKYARRVYRLMDGGAESLRMAMADRIRPFRYAVKRGCYRLLAQAFPDKRMHFAERMEHYSDERARCRSFI